MRDTSRSPDGRRRSNALLALRVGNPRRVTRVDEYRHCSVDANHVPLVTNDRYRLPLSYQPPMAARVGVEIAF